MYCPNARCADAPSFHCRQFRPSAQVWADFVSVLKSDKSFSYLYEIVDLLTGSVAGGGTGGTGGGVVQEDGGVSFSTWGEGGAGPFGQQQGQQQVVVAAAQQ